MAEIAVRHRSGLCTGRMSRTYILKLTGIVVGLGATFAYAAGRYDVAHDGQWFRCMEAEWFVVDQWADPDRDPVETLDVLAFNAGEAQAIDTLGWQEGMLMGKIALATEAGTEIKVGLEGVRFTDPTGRSWKYGRGLEAAEVLKTDPSEFVRTYTLQEGEIWMMGEMPFSVDSRYYGPITTDQVVGKVVARW